MNVNLRALIGKLNHETRSAVEAAAGLCLSRTHYDVEIEHFLLKALDATDGDLALVLKHFGVEPLAAGRRPAAVARQAEDRQRAHAHAQPVAGEMPHGGVDHRLGGVRRRAGAHRLRAARAHSPTTSWPHGARHQPRIREDPGRGARARTSSRSPRRRRRSAARSATFAERRRDATGSRAPGGKTPYSGPVHASTSPSAPARASIDPVLGRDFEVRQVVDILTRRRQNNPILVGEAGVGQDGGGGGLRAAHRRRATCRRRCAT